MVACGAYVFYYFRHDLDAPNTLWLVVVAGTFALCWFLFSATSDRFHPLVTTVLVGCGALVATACAAAFLKYTWTEQAQLQETKSLPGFVLFCLLAVGTTAIAWKAFWNCLRGKIVEGDDDDPD